jgi:PAS domain S-box-containing protein
MRSNLIHHALPSTLRMRLLLLLVLALIPALVFIFIITVRARQSAIEDVAATTHQLAELAASSQEQLIARVRQLLVTLSHLPEVRGGDVSACSGLLARLLEQHHDYINFGVIELDGSIRCSALPVEQAVDVADRSYFQQALQTGDLSVGIYQVGRITHLPSINFGYPVFAGDGEPQAVVFTAFDLRAMSDIVAEVQLNHDAALTLVDRSGIILARSPDTEGWAGQSLPDAPIIAAMLSNPGVNTLEAVGVDGIARLYTHIPIANTSEASLYVSVGIPVAVADAAAQRILLFGLFALVLVFVLALAAIWFGGEYLILRPLASLLRATQQLSAGDLRARAAPTGGPTEIQHLAHAFDDMAAALEHRETELKRSAEMLEQRNERLRTLHAIDRAILTSQSPEVTVQSALDVVHRQVLAFYTGITLFDFDAGEGVLFADTRTGASTPAPARHFSLATFPDDYFDRLRRGEMVIVEDVGAMEEPPPGLQVLLAEGMRSHIWIPLLAQDGLLGSFNLASDRPDAFTNEQIIIAREVADQLAIAIQQARLRQQVQQYTLELEARVAERTAQLHQIRDRVETILNHNSDAILLLHSDGTVQQTNPAFNQMFGYEPDELFGKLLASLVRVENVELLMQTFQEVVESQQPGRLEVTVHRKDDDTFDADIVVAPIRKQNVPVEDVICSIRDISERKRVEQELRIALDKEKELNELKSRFASMVSHEFRTPLSVIMSSSDLLKRYSDRLTGERRLEHLDVIQAHVRQLVELLDNVLTISRAEAVGVDFNPRQVDLTEVCRQLAEQIQLTTQQHQIGFSVTGDCAQVMADERLLRQAISNLLTNAIKYSPQGGMIKLDLSCTDKQVTIRVQDKGIGIPERDQQRLFETFHRAENVGVIAGTGLGMAIIRQAVDAHNGSITFDSQVGVGSTFIIELPAAPHRS